MNKYKERFLVETEARTLKDAYAMLMYSMACLWRM